MAQASESQRRTIRIWLYVIAGLVVFMVMVGGATRLTDSGLSIVEWRPVTGTMPPLSQSDWIAEFEKYKTSSEYEIVNKGMTLDAFKRIYWWEWGHRLLGRFIGAAFLLPFLYFLIRGWVEPGLKWRLWLIFALGGLQGVIGWWMVASGLVNRVDVAQERLAIHLVIACLIVIALVWTAREMAPANMKRVLPRRLGRTAMMILTLLIVQIAIGGLVAGLKAGLIYNTWPLIDGAFIPVSERLFFLSPIWTNFLDNHLTVQFTHRMAAYVLIGLAAVHAVDCARHDTGAHRANALALASILAIQTMLGITTLLWHVPMALALIHQSIAMVAVILATIHAKNLQVRKCVEQRLQSHTSATASERLSSI
ncbi:MAG: COX15/CtaA family protein [Rhizobiales bacterium]|nr:COX15/CtaA family protein [Hyphomicrobiales bacterium]